MANVTEKTRKELVKDLDAARDKAHAARDKAYTARDKAYTACDKADAACDKAWKKAKDAKAALRDHDTAHKTTTEGETK